MFSSIKLKSFQAFDKAKNVDLAPLTLIFGPNASGKSSISRAIKLWRQSIDSSSGLENGFRFSGPDVNLNGFRSVVFGQIEELMERDAEIGIELSIPSDELPRKVNGVKEVSIEVQVGHTFNLYGVEEGIVQYIHNRTRFWFDENLHDLIGRSGLEFAVRLENGSKNNIAATVRFINFDSSGEVYEGNVATYGQMSEILTQSASDDEERKILQESVEQLESMVNETIESWFNMQESHRWDDSDDELLDEDGDNHQPDDWTEIFSDRAQLSNNFVRMKNMKAPTNYETVARRNFLADVFQAVRMAILANLSNTTHVGPIRDIPRLVDGAEPFGTLPTAKANAWLKKLTNGRYEILRERVGIQSHAHEIWVNLVKDNFTGVLNSFEDVGTGISQVFPVINSVVSPQAKRWANSRSEIVVIEQPELHLHPSAQSTVGDMFVECINDPDRNLQIIVETHSENLLLRIQKNIRDGRLTPEQVAIIFVEPVLDSETGNFVDTSVRRLSLDKAGDILDPFPISFADMRIQDLL